MRVNIIGWIGYCSVMWLGCLSCEVENIGKAEKYALILKF